MKTQEIQRNLTVNLHTTSIMLDKKGQIPDLKILHHSYHPETGQTTIVLQSSMLTADNYKLLIRDDQIGLVLMEHIEFDRPVYVHHYKWQNIQHQAYDRFHSANISLPGSNYHLLSHQYSSTQNLLEITLGNLNSYN
ncbi:MAG: hypothetical protein ACERKD_22020 [Prolixibacteraceae bacterium]